MDWYPSSCLASFSVSSCRKWTSIKVCTHDANIPVVKVLVFVMSFETVRIVRIRSLSRCSGALLKGEPGSALNSSGNLEVHEQLCRLPCSIFAHVSISFHSQVRNNARVLPISFGLFLNEHKYNRNIATQNTSQGQQQNYRVTLKRTGVEKGRVHS